MEFLRRPRYIAHLRRPRQPASGGPDESPWVRCPQCRELLYIKELEADLKVCLRCGHHLRLTAAERIGILADEGTFCELYAGLESADPLGFVASDGPYSAKLRETQAATGLREAVVCGTCLIAEQPAMLAVLDFAFLGASMGSAVGEKIALSLEEARNRRLPLVAVSASGGARMHEGILSLMQMAKTVATRQRLAEARLPFISILTDPTTGGVLASFASLGDVLIGEPGALIGFAGPRVIEQTTRQKLPPGFQRAEFLLEHGMIDMVVPRVQLKDTVARVLRLLHPTAD